MKKTKKKDTANTALRYSNHAQSTAFYKLKTVLPQDGWEVASVGIQISSGQPQLRQGKQVSHGIVLDMEEDVRALSYNKLRKITGLDITEENYKSFIPQKNMEEFNRLSQHTPIKASKQDCKCNNTKQQLDYLYIRTVRAFGADIVLFNNYKDGYHVFYMVNMNSGNWLPIKTKLVPTLEDIDALFAQYQGWDTFDIYDRLLTEEEICWFRNIFSAATDDPDDTWNDMYGRTHTDYEYSINGEKFVFSHNTVFSREMHNHLVKLAKGGLIVT